MAKGLTDIAIRNLSAGDMRREIPDPGCAGLYVIVQPSGKRSFAVCYRFDGRPKKLTLPAAITLAAARKLAGDALFDVAQGRDPSSAKKETRAKAAAAKADTVQALCENYLKREAGKLRTGRARQRVLERLVYPAIGDMPLASIKRSHIVKMLDEIEDENGAKMSDLTLAYVRKIFNWHASRVDDFNSPIVQSMSRYDAKANQGTRTLTDDELCKLWLATEPNDNAQQPFHALVPFLLLTGARRSEVNGMPWSEISNGVWTLPPERNKVKTELRRPLSQAALRVLESIPRIEGTRFVFGHGGKAPLSLTKPTQALKAATGTEGWRVHDLRRTARTLLSRAGIGSDIAERCLGHVVGGIRGTYDKHKYEKEMQQAYEALASLIENIVRPSTARVLVMRRKDSLAPSIAAVATQESSELRSEVNGR